MKSAGQIKQKAKQTIFRHRKKYVEAGLSRRPQNCAYNERVTLPVHKGRTMRRVPRRILIVGDDILPDKNLLWGHLIAHKRYQDSNVAILGRIAWPKDLPTNTLMAHIDGIGAQQFRYASELLFDKI